MALYILGRCLTRGRVPKKYVVMNMAGVLPPARQIIHGGKVKLIQVRDKFGETWKGFNTAYFASSGLPFAPTLWLKIYKMFGVKTVWNQNGFAYKALYPQRVVDRINGLMKPMLLADFIVFQTKFTKHCAEQFVGPVTKPHEVIINPVDTKKFKPTDSTLTAEPFTIIMAGNHFESEERMKVSIEAVKKVREKTPLKLIIIGKCEFDINEDWIEKAGAFTQEKAPTLYQKAHMLLHLKYLDPCPTVVLEALATGLPVVGQGNGGMPELVDPQSGILLPVAEEFTKLHYPQVDEVAEAILKIKAELPRYSNSARTQALKFDKEIWLNRHEAIFNKLLQ